MKINATLQKLIVEFLGATLFLIALSASISHSLVVPELAIAATLGLALLITSGISGGHLNPVVSLYFYSRKSLSLSDFLLYVAAQIGGALFGTFIGMQLWSKAVRTLQMGSAPDLSVLLGEWVATGGLVFLFGFLVATKRANLIPFTVAVWVFSAASFTQSGAQANPAVTLALILNGQGVTTSGWIIIAQLVGLLSGILGVMVFTAKPVKAKSAKKAAKK
ncbi:MAG: aquaporin [Rhodoluna sp.]|jgi:glycerol uptake facilitator-like aquaporin|nr:aquaporin [Rhodoluna sp.]MBP7818741.1 aquaporin [Rhodoluna sp.]